MKFKTEKRFISIALVICMLLSLCFVTNATGTTANELELATAEKIEQMVSAFYSGIPGDYEIGNAITIYNADVDSIYYVIPIFRDDECVGTAEVDSMGNVSLCDDTTLYANVSELSLSEYLLYTTGGIVYAESEGTTVELYDSGLDCSENEEFAHLSYIEKTTPFEIRLETLINDFDISSVIECVELTDVIIVGMAPRADVLPITIRKCSITNFVTQGNYNICWAACVATIVNFKKKLNLSAANVAVAMGHTNYTSPSYPGANESVIISAFSHYGLTYNFSSTKLGWSLVKNNINNNRPFMMGVYSQFFSGHMLTAYGYECNLNESVRYIYVWDSMGTGSKLLLDYGASSYSLYGYTFTWIATIK